MADLWRQDGGYPGPYGGLPQVHDERYLPPHVSQMQMAKVQDGVDPYGNIYVDIGHQGGLPYRAEQVVPNPLSWGPHSPDDTQSIDDRDSTRSTPAPSKERRLKINGHIKTICKLLPIKDTTKTRLSQHNTMSYSIVYIRKNKVLGKGLPTFSSNPSLFNIPLSEFAGECGDITGALTGFMIVTTKDGKLIYLSENVTQYLGHSMVDMLTQGDNITDIIDRKYHDEFLRKLRDACDNMDRQSTGSDDVTLFCQMKVRSQKRQSGSGDQKLMHIKGHFTWLHNHYSEPIFMAICNPLITPDFKDSMVQTSTMTFRTVHQPNMVFTEIWHVGEYHLGYTNEEIVGRSWYEMIHPKDDQLARAKHKQLFSHGHAPELGCMLTIRMMTKSGNWIWLNLIMHVDRPYSSSDEPAVVVVINQVISEQEVPLYRDQSHKYSPNIVSSPEPSPDTFGASYEGIQICPVHNPWENACGPQGYMPTTHQPSPLLSLDPYGQYSTDYYRDNAGGDGSGSYTHAMQDVPTVVGVFNVNGPDPPKNAFVSPTTILPEEPPQTLAMCEAAIQSEQGQEVPYTCPLTPDSPSKSLSSLPPAGRYKLQQPRCLPTPDTSPLASPTHGQRKKEKQSGQDEVNLAVLTVDDVRNTIGEDFAGGREVNANRVFANLKRRLRFPISNRMIPEGNTKSASLATASGLRRRSADETEKPSKRLVCRRTQSCSDSFEKCIIDEGSKNSQNSPAHGSDGAIAAAPRISSSSPVGRAFSQEKFEWNSSDDSWSKKINDPLSVGTVNLNSLDLKRTQLGVGRSGKQANTCQNEPTSSFSRILRDTSGSRRLMSASASRPESAYGEADRVKRTTRPHDLSITTQHEQESANCGKSIRMIGAGLSQFGSTSTQRMQQKCSQTLPNFATLSDSISNGTKLQMPTNNADSILSKSQDSTKVSQRERHGAKRRLLTLENADYLCKELSKLTRSSWDESKESNRRQTESNATTHFCFDPTNQIARQPAEQATNSQYQAQTASYACGNQRWFTSSSAEVPNQRNHINGDDSILEADERRIFHAISSNTSRDEPIYQTASSTHPSYRGTSSADSAYTSTAFTPLLDTVDGPELIPGTNSHTLYSNSTQPLFPTMAQRLHSHTTQSSYPTSTQPLISSTTQPFHSTMMQPIQSNPKQSLYSRTIQPSHSASTRSMYSSGTRPLHSTSHLTTTQPLHSTSHPTTTQPSHSSTTQLVPPITTRSLPSSVQQLHSSRTQSSPDWCSYIEYPQYYQEFTGRDHTQPGAFGSPPPQSSIPAAAAWPVHHSKTRTSPEWYRSMKSPQYYQGYSSRDVTQRSSVDSQSSQCSIPPSPAAPQTFYSDSPGN